MDEHNPARNLLLRETFGVLSTISIDVAGYPFGSVTPYCVDRAGSPVIYISPIAQHTKNIMADPRVSLTVVEKQDSDDVQAHGRVTCMGRAVQNDSDRDAAERYFRHFPSSRQYDRTHAFSFFRLELIRIRFIGGFGQIFWVAPDEFSLRKSIFARGRNPDHSAHESGSRGSALSPCGQRQQIGRCGCRRVRSIKQRSKNSDFFRRSRSNHGRRATSVR